MMRMQFDPSDTSVRRSVVSLALVFVLALLPVACGSSNDDDLAVASGLIERWIAGWNDDDPDAIAAVFTEDGTQTVEGVHNFSHAGREEIRTQTAPVEIRDMESTGPVSMADDGTFTCPVEFRAGPYDMVAEIDFEVDDGLISLLVGHDEFATSAD